MPLMVIATHNQGKAREFKELLPAYDVKTSQDFAIPEPIENGADFIANANIKTEAVRDWFLSSGQDLPDFILADDSGLSVEDLDGAPGVFSARWAGADKNFTTAMKKIETALLQKNINHEKLYHPHCRAYFSCALSLWDKADNKIIPVIGKAEGFLQFPPKGKYGFGYDPIFVPIEEMTKPTPRRFAEMSSEEKDAISHRTRALQQLSKQLAIQAPKI